MRNRSQTTRATLISFLSFSLAISFSGAAAGRPHGKEAAAPAARGAKAAAKESAPAKDAPLSFTRVGKGPAVVLIHGLGGDHAVWAPELMRLSEKFTVVAVDLPGHGLSVGPKAAPPAAPGQPAPPIIDLQQVAQRIAKLIRDEKLAPAVVVGHSIGGQIAAWVPLVDRDAVRGVLLVDSSLSPPPFSDSDRTRLRADLKRDMISTLRRFFAPMTSNATQLDKIVASAQRVAPAVLMGYIDSAVSSELDDKVSNIQVPVHLLAGPMLIADNNDQTKAKLSLQALGVTNIRSFTYDYFPTSKHWLFWDEPERFRDDMDRFLSSVTQPAVSATKSRPKL